eukprot:CCRYP_007439-RA/>CCRYP_007439-RA protein AED:0.40 eAED:0.44 QI:0/-1/0/1/-1/1/1/0/106
MQKHGAHTPRITPWSVAVTTKTELLREVLLGKLHESPANSRPKKSYAQVLACMEKLEKSLKKANKKARNVAVEKKVTAIPTHPEVLGRVVPGKMKIVVRKLKLATS